MVLPRELIQQAAVLKVLSKTKPKLLKQQIKQLPPVVIHTIKRLSKNYIKGNIKLTPKQLSRIRRYKKQLQELALSKTSVARSRRLMQKGGFLTSLIGPIIGILSSLFTRK